MTARLGVGLARPAIGEYRQAVLRMLLDHLGGDLQVFAGASDFAPTSRTTIDLGSHLTPVDNRYLLGRRLLWQRRTCLPLIRADVAVLELNPRVLSAWVVIACRKVLGRPTVLWGHAFPRAGRHARSDRLRGAMRRLADALVVYTETERSQLLELHPTADVFAAPNALYPADRIGPAQAARVLPNTFVCVGRLVETKKPRLLVEAFLLARPELPEDIRLVFVGAGPLQNELEAATGACNGAVTFLGHVADFERLRDVYSTAIASVSPGEAGLSLVQSLGFGVPVLVSRDEPHGPEIEAAREGVNSKFVDSGSPEAMARALVRFAAERANWLEKRESIAAECGARYSAEATARGLYAAIQFASRG